MTVTWIALCGVTVTWTAGLCGVTVTRTGVTAGLCGVTVE